MILLADSGSTKTEWCAVEQGNIARLVTSGINPYYRNSGEIEAVLRAENFVQSVENELISKIYFYGAGCTGPEKNEIVHRALCRLFPNLPASDIFVGHDMAGAAHGLCAGRPGVACILGTGSNSAVYDGEKISEHRPGLGYILGDEGSGAYLGKQLLRDFLYREMPKNISQKLTEEYQIDRTVILEKVYREAYPNRYLAGFCRFIGANISEPYCADLVRRAFALFFRSTLCKYAEAQTLPVHFTGSVAFHFSDILKETADDFGLKIGQITQSPTEGLAAYHQINK